MSLLQPSASCGVQECSKSELPPGLAHPEVSADCSEEDDNGSAVDDSLSEEAIRDLRDWKDHDDSQVGGFCEVDGANSDKYGMTINFEISGFFSTLAMGTIYSIIFFYFMDVHGPKFCFINRSFDKETIRKKMR